MVSEFVKEKVFWTRKMNLNLVKFIEKQPHIWNPKHPKYTSLDLRDQTYAEFAANYGNQFTGQAVKDRWTNIRSTFANYLRKLNISRAKGNGMEYKVHWHLWPACQFLIKVKEKLKVESAASDANCDEEEEVKDTELPIERGWTSEEDENYKRTSDSNSNCKNFASDLLTVFRNVQNDGFGLNNTKYGKVGRDVTRKLSQMNSYDSARLSHKIMEILLLYDQNNPSNPNKIAKFKSEYTL